MIDLKLLLTLVLHLGGTAGLLWFFLWRVDRPYRQQVADCLQELEILRTRQFWRVESTLSPESLAAMPDDTPYSPEMSIWGGPEPELPSVFEIAPEAPPVPEMP